MTVKHLKNDFFLMYIRNYFFEEKNAKNSKSHKKIKIYKRKKKSTVIWLSNY